MPAKHGLGRGLGALIRDGVAPVPANETPGIARVPLDSITAGAWQPRRRFDEAALAELAQSIRLRGVLQPLLVRGAGDGYELIAGERRLRAAARAGLAEVPVIITEAPDEAALEIALIENLQREDLNVVEEADGYQLLVDRFGLTHEQAAERVGKSRSAVTNALRIRALPDEVKALVMQGDLTAGHAKLITGLAVPEEQVLVAREAARNRLSVRDLERLIKRRTRPPRKPRARRADIPPDHLDDLVQRLHTHFGTGVAVTPTHTLANGRTEKGAIRIEFYSNDDLDRILGLLGITFDA